MTTTATPTPPETAAAAEDVVGRLFTEGVGAAHLLCVHIGHKLGLFDALAGERPLTVAALARATALDERYVREWVQAEAIAGLLSIDGDVDTGHCSLAPGVREALVEETSPFYMGGLSTAIAVAGATLPKVVDAFRTGEGVPYAEYGPEAVEAQAALNRPAFTNSLVAEWLPQMPDVLARLQDTALPARVVDLGCGVGWSSIELAEAFPHIHVTGIDSDDESISQARHNAAERGVADRVAFEVGDISGDVGAAAYDIALFFECLHDLARPVEALAAARRALAEGGSVIVMDERVGDTMPEPGDPTETFFATVSVLWCLPQGRVGDGAAPVGTVMRPDALRRLATTAGYAAVDVLPIDHPFWRFYRLVP